MVALVPLAALVVGRAGGRRARPCGFGQAQGALSVFDARLPRFARGSRRLHARGSKRASLMCKPVFCFSRKFLARARAKRTPPAFSLATTAHGGRPPPGWFYVRGVPPRLERRINVMQGWLSGARAQAHRLISTFFRRTRCFCVFQFESGRRSVQSPSSVARSQAAKKYT
jgi:hypothetical protein